VNRFVPQFVAAAKQIDEYAFEIGESLQQFLQIEEQEISQLQKKI